MDNIEEEHERSLQTQNLPHAFHENLERLFNVDRLRMSIYNFYAIITGGSLAALATQEWNHEVGVWVFLFLAVISAITLKVNMRIKDHVGAFMIMLRKIAQQMEIGEYYTDGANQNTKIKLRNIYICVPLVGLIVFTALFGFQLCKLLN